MPTPILTTGLNLLISDKPDPERDALADAFAGRGGAVHRLDRFWDPPAFDPATVRVYGADSFCLVLQQKLDFDLCSPADDLLLHVPPQFLRRQIAQRTLSDALAALVGEDEELFLHVLSRPATARLGLGCLGPVPEGNSDVWARRAYTRKAFNASAPCRRIPISGSSASPTRLSPSSRTFATTRSSVSVLRPSKAS